MPQGADTVVMQEDVTKAPDGTVFVPAGLKAGANCRQAGEDVAAGDAILAPGHRLRPQDIAAASSVGADRLQCFDRLEVAIASTGDELLPPGAQFHPGGVYDANRPMLTGLIAAAGANPVELETWPDGSRNCTHKVETGCR